MKGEMKVDLLNLRKELNWQSLSIDMRDETMITNEYSMKPN